MKLNGTRLVIFTPGSRILVYLMRSKTGCQPCIFTLSRCLDSLVKSGFVQEELPLSY